jgi:O-glycosyl hydrolase
MNHRYLAPILLALTLTCSARKAPQPERIVNGTADATARFNRPFLGWGVSLCWWANECGKWDDQKIDEIVDWLVSPQNLNYRVFRYNIGGGDDPQWRHCSPHHFGHGKGLRAEMEGFKDGPDEPYNWSRDAAQRKIMLKIRERRPDAVFEAFSNSAPYWMTLSGCCAGNVNATDDNLDPRYYDTFAHYLVDVCTFYRDSFNLVFHTLEPFNEPVTNYWKANDSQEGCHFSLTEQLKFVKVLAPVLKASGLPTLISASDETSVSQSVIDLKGYIADRKALSLIGQWNTHTYAADNASRQELRTLATSADRPLWMSEVGGGSGGIKGNLELAHKLIQDIRFLQPDVWCDWQYMEEYGDQWSLINGRFNKQVYRKTKNYYVHYQFTHYISSGYRFIDLGQRSVARSPLPRLRHPRRSRHEPQRTLRSASDTASQHAPHPQRLHRHAHLSHREQCLRHRLRLRKRYAHRRPTATEHSHRGMSAE